MSDFNNGFSRPAPAAADMAMDTGLRGFMLGVYNKVALGLIISAALAFVTSSVAPVAQLFYNITPEGQLRGVTLLGMLVGFSPLVVLLIGRFAVKQTPLSTAAVYWLMVSLFGASMGVWVLAYTASSIAITFLITAVAFGSLSIWGYTTKRSLSGFGSFLLVGLVGLILAQLVTMFFPSTMMNFIISIVGVLIFAGLIAFDTQRLKLTYYQLGGDQASMAMATNYGALSLYLDFLNLFLFLLRLIGGRR